MLKREFTKIFIFQGLSEDQIELIRPLVNLCRYYPGKVIFNQGQRATHLYIVASGEVIINFKPYDGPSLTVSRMGPGGVFGWSSTLGRDVYNSAAVSVTETEVYQISGDALRNLCEHHPDAGVVILEKLASAIAERLESTHTQIMGILSQGMDLDPGDAGKGK